MALGVHRVVVKLQIEDDRLYSPFKAGETVMNDNDFNWLKTNYPDSIVEIPMSEQEWIQYLSSEAHKSYEKATKLQTICEQLGLEVELPVAFYERTGSLGDIATEGRMMNPKYYGGGLSDVVSKAWTYKRDVEAYEERVFSKLNVNSRTR